MVLLCLGPMTHLLLPTLIASPLDPNATLILLLQTANTLRRGIQPSEILRSLATYAATRTGSYGASDGSGAMGNRIGSRGIGQRFAVDMAALGQAESGALQAVHRRI